MENYLNEYLSGVDNTFTNQNVTYKAQFSEMLCSTEEESTHLDKADISFW